MVNLTFYGGINEIGGNKILLEEGERKLLLDFGFPYKRHKQFYEEYLKPRSGAGLLDPLIMHLLPPLEGIYRDDLVSSELWEQFREEPLYRELDRIDGVLLSHAHLDHSGYISFLKEDIPIFSTATTAFITKAMQDSGRAGFDQQVCYFSPTSQDYRDSGRKRPGKERSSIRVSLILTKHVRLTCAVSLSTTLSPVPAPGALRLAPAGLFIAETFDFTVNALI